MSKIDKTKSISLNVINKEFIQKLKNTIIRHGFLENIESFEQKKKEEKNILQQAEYFIQVFGFNDKLSWYFTKYFNSKEYFFKLLDRCQYRITTLFLLEMFTHYLQDQNQSPKQTEKTNTYFDSCQISQKTKETDFEVIPQPLNRFTSSLIEMPNCKEYIQKNSYIESKGSYLFGNFDSNEYLHSSQRKKSTVDQTPLIYLKSKQPIKDRKKEQPVQRKQQNTQELLKLLQSARRSINLCNKEFENQISFQKQEIKLSNEQSQNPGNQIQKVDNTLQKKQEPIESNLKSQNNQENIQLLCQKLKRHLNSTPEIELEKINLEQKTNHDSIKSQSEQKIPLQDRFAKSIVKDMLSIDYQQKKKKNYSTREFDIISNQNKF